MYAGALYPSADLRMPAGRTQKLFGENEERGPALGLGATATKLAVLFETGLTPPGELRILWQPLPAPLPLGDQIPNDRHQVGRCAHDRLRRLNARLILGHCLVPALRLIVSDDRLDPLLVPTLWKLALLHHCCFLFHLRPSVFTTKTLALGSQGSSERRRGYLG